MHVVSEQYDDPAAPLATHRPAVVLAEGSDSMLADALAAVTERPDAASGVATSPTVTTWSGTS